MPNAIGIDKRQLHFTFAQSKRVYQCKKTKPTKTCRGRRGVSKNQTNIEAIKTIHNNSMFAIYHIIICYVMLCYQVLEGRDKNGGKREIEREKHTERERGSEREWEWESSASTTGDRSGNSWANVALKSSRDFLACVVSLSHSIALFLPLSRALSLSLSVCLMGLTVLGFAEKCQRNTHSLTHTHTRAQTQHTHVHYVYVVVGIVAAVDAVVISISLFSSFARCVCVFYLFSTAFPIGRPRVPLINNK